ncbi:MAG: PAS domain-containing sensor histidine kinase [Chryseobacterium sp.]|nr:MAG: PAS domain-containing sensor histidine kinase [Chryseobacterium sp.]
MKRFDTIEFLKLKKIQSRFVVCITHQNKIGNSIAYLYPFKDKKEAKNFAQECIAHRPEIIEVDDKLKLWATENKYSEIYLSSIKDIYMRSIYFDNSEINFMLFDKELNVIDVNETMLKNYRMDRGQFIGKNLVEVLSTETDDGLCGKLMEVIHTGKPKTFEAKDDARYGGYHYRVKAFKVGNGVGLSSSNISNLKSMIHAQELFAYKFSHDIKSPIANTLALVNLAIEDEGKDPEILQKYIGMIFNEVKRLDDFTTLLLESLKFEKQKKVEKIDFPSIIGEVRRTLSFIEGFTEVTFYDTNIHIDDFFSNKIVLVSLFQNIFDNAIKYRKRGVEGAYVKTEIVKTNNFLRMSIADNGIGIEESKQSRIFNIFYRANEEVPGNGIGLYSIKQSIENLGGNISFKSSKNEGTEFVIVLPIKLE